jgi:hypothetical protein
MMNLIDEILELKQKVRTLEQNTEIRGITFPSDGYLIIPVVAADPSSPSNGQIWYNSVSNTFKGYENGSVVTFTTS